MSDYLIDGSTLEDIADAIRSKTGGSSLIDPEDMPTEIASISGGGGGSLPSVISKIDGGSFTPSSDTAGTSYWISHNLGVLPKTIVIWTEDSELLTSTAAVAQRYIISSLLVLVDWVTGSAQNGIFPTHLFRNTNGATSNTGSPITQSAVGNYIQTTRFNNALGAAYYKAGVEYKWVAFA